MDPAKLKAVADFPTPGSSKVHQFFTGDSFGILVKFPLMRETAAIVLYHVFFAFMSSLWMWSLTGVPSLHLSFGKNSVNMWGRTRVCPPGTILKPMVRPRKQIRTLEMVVCCVASAEPSTWRSRLTMIEYAHNSLPVLSTGLSPLYMEARQRSPFSDWREEQSVGRLSPF